MDVLLTLEYQTGVISEIGRSSYFFGYFVLICHFLFPAVFCKNNNRRLREEKVAHQISVKIYYEDTDAGGVVYYGNYLRYLERARTEFLLNHGINVAEWHNQGLFFVVTHVDIHYKRPARLGETIDITTEIAEMKKASVILKNLVFGSGIVLVEAYVTFACIDREGRPKRLPAELKNLGD